MARNILNLDNVSAKRYLLTQEAFLNIDLPPYFHFSDVLSKVEKEFKQKELNSTDLGKAKKFETVNHVLYGNKDGKYAWRRYQIMNPLTYVSLVNILTDKNNWALLKNRFKKFQAVNNIRCESLPVIPMGKKKQRALQISQWVNKVEKQSLALSLEYKFLYHTDISDCYGSIYTHSIPWAIHSKTIAKNKRDFNDLFGNKIDHHFQSMSHGQTNGIPQGSILSDLIAEIILGYADYKLDKKLKLVLNNKKYFILRYRDDYRIFVNDTTDGDIILKCLSETLLDLGFRLNTGKTSFYQDIIGASLKEDKVYSLQYGLVPERLTKNELLRQLLIIQQIGKIFPNSGVLKNRLSKILNVVKSKDYRFQESILTGVLMDIGYNNPNCFSLIAGLISDYISRLSKQSQRDLLIKIQKKICTLPNIGLLEVWVQRIALGLKHDLEFNELLCNIIDPQMSRKLFITDWIDNRKVKNIIDNGVYVDKSVLSKIKPKIDSNEIQMFSYDDR